MAGLPVNVLERGAVRLAWSAATHVGHVRQLNEDSFIAEPGVFAVADGMGGHAAGEVASRLAIDEWATLRDTVPLTAERVAAAVTSANRAVWDHALANSTPGMGTTLVGVALIDNAGEEALVVANVGDSRCYLLEAGELRRVTHDHSVVQELVDNGYISAEAADTHPERNVVTRAIGVEPGVAADFVILTRAPQQRLLLCSDGVSGQLPDDELAGLLAAAPDAHAAAASLLERVLAGPATDNATLIVIDVEWTRLGHAAADDVTGPRSARGVVADDDDTNPRGVLIVSVPGLTPELPPPDPTARPISETQR